MKYPFRSFLAGSLRFKSLEFLSLIAIFDTSYESCYGLSLYFLTMNCLFFSFLLRFAKNPLLIFFSISFFSVTVALGVFFAVETYSLAYIFSLSIRDIFYIFTIVEPCFTCPIFLWVDELCSFSASFASLYSNNICSCYFGVVWELWRLSRQSRYSLSMTVFFVLAIRSSKILCKLSKWADDFL